MNKKRPSIRFSVDDDQKKKIDEYAKQKGFDNASNLARVAIFNYMARNKIASKINAQRCTAHESDYE